MPDADIFVSLGNRGRINLLEVERIDPRGEYPDEATLVMRSGNRHSVSAQAAGGRAGADPVAAWSERISRARGAPPSPACDGVSAERKALSAAHGTLIKAAADILRLRTWGHPLKAAESDKHDEALRLLAIAISESPAVAQIKAALAAPPVGGLTDEQIDAHLDKILRASGSALKHYTMAKSKDDMRAALRAVLAAAGHGEPR